MHFVRPAVALTLCGIVACSAHDRSSDAVTTVSNETSSLQVERTLSAIHAHREFASFGTIDVATTSSVSPIWPQKANGALRLDLPGGVWAELVAEGLGEVEGARHDGALIFADAARATDVAWEARGDRVEEVRILQNENASRKLRYRLRTSPTIREVRVRIGRIELVDDKGYVHLSSEPMFAVDANGTRRDLTTTVITEGQADGAWTIVATLATEGLAYPIAVDPAWTTFPDCPQFHTNGGSAALADGRLLIFEGEESGGYNVYSPATNTWIGGSMGGAEPRAESAYAQLADGRVLLFGGISSTTELTDVRAFDSTTNTWSALASSTITGHFATAILLPDGRVLKVGGGKVGNGAAEIYAPTTNTWTTVASSPVNFYQAKAALLGDGRVHVHGSAGSGNFGAVFDPKTSTWTATAPTHAKYNDGAYSLTTIAADKTLLVGGPYGAGIGSSAFGEIYDATANTWTMTTAMSAYRDFGGTIAIGEGRVLAIGGLHLSTSVYVATAEIYDLATGTWNAAPALPANRAKFPPPRRIGNAIYIATGGDGSNKLTGYRYTLDDNGTACPTGSGAACASSHCVDGVCCADASCPSGKCNVAGSAGVCRKSDGVTCATDSECVNGHCADGYCCNTACTGQCEACDGIDKAGSNIGTCVAITGAPHKARAKCAPTPGGDACAVTSCNGVERASCAGFSGPDTSCRSESCTAGNYTAAAVCEGKGVCPKAVTVSCDGAKCDAAGKSCKTSCNGNDECVDGYRCETGKCKRITVSCSLDNTQSIPLTGDPVACSPYVCKTDGNCGNSCGTTAECATSFVCDVDTKTCVSTENTDSGGGCSTSSSGEAGGASTLVGFALALSLTRRLRRRRAA